MEHPGHKRHLDRGTILLGWASEVEVLCPKCGTHGVLAGDPYYKNWQGKFTCRQCSYQAATEKTGWVGEVEARGRQRCAGCGSKWVYVSKQYPHSGKTPETLVGICSHCKQRNKVVVRVWPNMPRDRSVDPFLGLELALKENTRNGVVWVYNATHLVELRAYIEANVREDLNVAWSYFSRLPTWIKMAKNRRHVLAAIRRLEERVKTLRAATGD